jgi:hypothetical protein
MVLLVVTSCETEHTLENRPILAGVIRFALRRAITLYEGLKIGLTAAPDPQPPLDQTGGTLSNAQYRNPSPYGARSHLFIPALAPQSSGLLLKASLHEKEPAMDNSDPMATERERALAAWTAEWTRLCRIQQGERGPPGRQLSNQQRDHLDQLYVLVENDLRRIAALPQHTWMGVSNTDRALVLFSCLIDGLASRKRDIVPEDGLRSLLMTIAKNRSIDLFRKHERPAQRETELTEALPNPGESGFDEELATKMHEDKIITAAYTFWATLSWPDGEIMRLRYDTSREFPRPFRSIATQLDNPLKPDTVEKIHNRTLKRTRDHLRRLGLLDQEGEE